MKKALMFAAFALSFCLMSLLLVAQANAWTMRWEVTWGGVSAELAVDVAVAPDGSIYVVGDTFSFAQGPPYYHMDGFILKYDQSGNLLWERTWGGYYNEFAYGVAVDPAGDYVYVVGHTQSFGPGDSAAFILEFDDAGNLMWDQTWGGLDLDSAADVAVHPSGDVYVVGYTGSFGTNTEAFLLGFHPDGTLFLQQTWGGDGTDCAVNLAIRGAEEIYMVGYTDSFTAGNFKDAFIVKFDEIGNLYWQFTWGGTGEEWAHGVSVFGGMIYVVGFTDSCGAGELDALIFKLNTDGVLIWGRTWGGAQEDRAYGVAARGKSIYVVGRTQSFGPGAPPNSFALRFNQGGKLVSDMTYGGDGTVWASDVALDPTADFYISGTTGIPFPPDYLTPVGGIVTKPDYALVTVDGIVTQTTAVPGTPNGIVMAPSGSTTFAGVSDATLIKMSD